jgi:glutaredoxin
MDQQIIQEITSHPGTFIIFYSPTCGYSQRALELLKQSGYAYNSYDINQIPGGMTYLLSVFNKYATQLHFDPNHQTKPMIWYNSNFIGGYTELNNLISSTKY